MPKQQASSLAVATAAAATATITGTLIETFPILYGVEKGGKIKTWCAAIYLKGANPSTSPAYAIIEHGQQEGKKQITQRDYTEGKNIGKKNETTPLAQCIAETKRKWTDKRDKESYQTTLPSQVPAHATATAPTTATTTATATAKKYFPMLAQTFAPDSKTAKKNTIVFPCYVQPKLDGLRCVIYRDHITGEIRRQSRTGTYFDTMTHITDSLAPLFAKYPTAVLDGELYTTEMPFEELAGLIKRKLLDAADHEKLNTIEYHIYDVIDETPTATYEERYKTIKRMFASLAASSASSARTLPPYIRLVHTVEAKTPADFKSNFAQFIEEGYEGIMLRNKEGKYRCNFRSHDLQKYKEFMEDEYAIIGYTQGDGRDKGTVIWICQTKDKNEFKVRPRGTIAARTFLYNNGDKYIGKMLTVIYQELTEEGKPRFPVGKDVRENY
jgi:DNA ligase-1